MAVNEEALTRAVRDLIFEAAPERRTELEALWEKYRPQINHKTDKPGFDIEGGAWGLIAFTPRTMGQIWLLGFAAWRTLEAYCPFLVLGREIVASTMGDISGQAEADFAFERDLAKAEDLRAIPDIEAFTWPSHIPRPEAPPQGTVQDQATIDLIKIAGAYVFLHELRHVIFWVDKNQPPDPHDEELACDSFARDFLLERIPDYSAASGYNQQDVLNKRLMGLALGGFILLHVQPAKSASDTHPAIALRLRELVRESTGAGARNAWHFACCVLLSILRREGRLPAKVTFSDPQDLFARLIPLLEDRPRGSFPSS